MSGGMPTAVRVDMGEEITHTGTGSLEDSTVNPFRPLRVDGVSGGPAVGAVAPRGIPGAVALADGLLAGVGHFHHDRGKAGVFAGVSAVAVGQLGGQAALAVRFPACGFVNDQGSGTVYWISHEAISVAKVCESASPTQSDVPRDVDTGPLKTVSMVASAPGSVSRATECGGSTAADRRWPPSVATADERLGGRYNERSCLGQLRDPRT